MTNETTDPIYSESVCRSRDKLSVGGAAKSLLKESKKCTTCGAKNAGKKRMCAICGEEVLKEDKKARCTNARSYFSRTHTAILIVYCLLFFIVYLGGGSGRAVVVCEALSY
jgi:hypothetical protein